MFVLPSLLAALSLLSAVVLATEDPKYKGCFRDEVAPNRDLNGDLIEKKMSVDKCKLYCNCAGSDNPSQQ